MSTLGERIALAANRLYPRVVYDAGAVLTGVAPVGTLDELAGHKYCIVVTYRRNGLPVATPVWFGNGNGRIFFRSLADTAKVRRLRSNQRVLIAPCTTRGRPLGPPFRGRARILSGAEAMDAERWIQANYGLLRRIYEWMIADADATYVEVAPEARDHHGNQAGR